MLEIVLKLMINNGLICLKTVNILNSKILKVYFADYESILILEDNVKQSLEESYTNMVLY